MDNPLVDNNPVMENWHPTHTLAGVPVMRVKRERDPSVPRIKTTRGGRHVPVGVGPPIFYAEDGSTVPLGRGRKPIPHIAIANALPPSAPVVFEVDPKPVPGEIVLLDGEVAACIHRCVAWPQPEAPIGYAESASGHSATLVKTLSDCSIVRVCVKKNYGGYWVTVNVPRQIPFLVEE